MTDVFWTDEEMAAIESGEITPGPWVPAREEVEETLQTEHHAAADPEDRP